MSQSDDVVIYCRSSNDKEDIGMGHVVRCGHLAKVLGDRVGKALIATNTNSDGCGYLLRQGLTVSDVGNPMEYDFETDILIVDLQENDDEFLRWVRPMANKLAVVVGAGKTITERTHWIADLIVYQAPKMRGQEKGIPGERVLSGLEYIMIDPAYAGADWQENMRMYDSVVYVGGGVPKGYKDRLLEALDELKIGYVMHGPDCWTDDMMRDLQNSYLFVGTMGMVVYEALACNTIPVVVGRSRDHVECAGAIGITAWTGTTYAAKNRVQCLGLASEESSESLAIAAVKVLNDKWLHYNERVVDGLGVYRVAEEILRL